MSMLLSAIPPAVTFSAEGPSNKNIKDGHDEIANGEEKDENEAKFNKQVSFGDKPGEYFIDLTVEGKDLNDGMTTDIVIPYDLSNSMENNTVSGTNKTRTEVTAEAIILLKKEEMGC